MKRLILLAAIAFLCQAHLSVDRLKTKTITGQVHDAGDQHPIEGVTVQVKGTKNISGSQEDGIYYIVVQASDSILVFTHPDYEGKEVRLTQENEYNIELKRKQK